MSVTSVDVLEIQNFLVPGTGGDIDPAQVTVIAPNGGEVLVGNVATTVQWSATDVSGVAAGEDVAHFGAIGNGQAKAQRAGVSLTRELPATPR